MTHGRAVVPLSGASLRAARARRRTGSCFARRRRPCGSPGARPSSSIPKRRLDSRAPAAQARPRRRRRACFRAPRRSTGSRFAQRPRAFSRSPTGWPTSSVPSRRAASCSSSSCSTTPGARSTTVTGRTSSTTPWSSGRGAGALMVELLGIVIALACFAFAFALVYALGPRLMSARRHLRARHLGARARVPRLRPVPRREAVTGNGITQIVLYAVDPDGARVPARHLHGARLRGHAAHAALARRAGARLLPAHGHAGRRGAGLEGVREDRAHLHGRLRRPALPAAAPAGAPAAEPGRPRGRELVGLDEHDRELRHEHELAVLRRRVHDVVPEPDGRARGAELRLGGARDGRARRRHPRLLAALREHGRQLLGRLLPLARLHPAAARGRSWRCCSSPRASSRRSTARRPRRRSRAASSRSRAARPRRRSPSSSWGRTAAASTTRTRPSPSRTRTASRTCSSCWRSC